MCDVMDDTVLVNKMLLAELHTNPDAEKAEGDDGYKPSPILDLVQSETGSRLFLLLLVSKDEDDESGSIPGRDGEQTKTAPRWQRYLDPYELTVLHRNPAVVENGETTPTSKKADETRRQELLVYLKDLLVEACIGHTGEMMRSKPGSRILMEVCESFPSEELFASIIEACEDADAGEGGDGESSLSMLEDPVGHLTIKHMFISESKVNPESSEPSLARMFLCKFGKQLGDVASSNRGAFVLSALMQTGLKDDVKKALKSHTKNIAQLAKGSKDTKKLAGCGVLLDALKA
jgi:hypothetical protein